MSELGLDWNSIRPHGGSKAHSFEELCAQLARAESPKEARFERKGTPDAGVECFCVLPNKGEWGWQAKFFQKLGDNQWTQIDRSVKTALEKHPSLARYFICVPYDRPDARVENQQSALQKWGNHVKKWKRWAKKRGQQVEFIWWGKSELIQRLAKTEHVGLLYFFFGEQGFDSAWLQDKLETAIESAGPRYTPEIHVDLPISQDFEYFGRTNVALDEIKSLTTKIRGGIYIDKNLFKPGTEAEIHLKKLLRLRKEIMKDLSTIPCAPDRPLPCGDIVTKVSTATDLARKTIASLTEDTLAPHEQYSDPTGMLNRLQGQLRSIVNTLKLAEEIANGNLMILTGEFGTGKTHLLCDIAKKRNEAGAPTILLMGQRFTSNEDPWKQALQHLDISQINTEKFVGALESAAKAMNSRALVMIDALNEGQGPDIWPHHLAAFLAPLNKSPWISVVLSVPSTYKETVIPEEILNQAVIVNHRGFSDKEYDAAKTFFSHYGLEFPSTPILQPEFSNPLFLKILCEGLLSQGKTQLPRGFHGISAAFDLYLDAINRRLAKRLNYNPGDNLVSKALRKIAQKFAETPFVQCLSRTEAEEVVNALLPGRDFSHSLYRGLVNEGVLLANMTSEKKEVVFFSYERLSNHIVVDFLLNTNLDPDTESDECAEEGSLAFICDQDQNIPSGLIEALSVQIPERTGRELVALAPKLLDHYGIGPAFRKSIVWRKPDAFSEETCEVLNNLVQYREDEIDTLETLLTVSTIADHPFNAEFLDRRLRQDSMPERDAWWSTYLHDTWETRGAVDRLVDWASGISASDNLEKKPLELCAITLTWMLTTSHRFLRDRVTKALVSLLTGRLEMTAKLINRFSDIDDPYITERVYAVVYGVAMRSYDPTSTGELALCVYENVFASGAPPAHIVLREYARGVIERALWLGADLEINEEQVRPPYKSSWPEIPDEETVNKIKEKDSNHSVWEIVDSVIGFGDFTRYVIGTNSGRLDWLPIRLDDEPWISPEEQTQDFLSKLDSSERAAWDRHEAAKNAFRRFLFQNNLPGDIQNNPELSKIEKEYTKALEQLESTLTHEHRRELKVVLKAQDQGQTPPQFDLSKIQRYVLWRVFDLGWTIDRFGQFDRSVKRREGYGRDPDKPERIGKKYQWIAYHEILAYISDHYQYRERFRESLPAKYEGLWQTFERDIDPSCTMRSLLRGTSWDGHSPSWWATEPYTELNDAAQHEDWVACKDNLPDVEKLLIASAPETDCRWLNLDGYFSWMQPTPAGVESDEVDRRALSLDCNGYFIQASNVDKFMNWAKGVQSLREQLPGMPGSESYNMFLGEYGWSQAYHDLSKQYQINHQDHPAHQCPICVMPASFSYSASSGSFDCSIDDSFTLSLPCIELVRSLDLQWTGVGADFLDRDGQYAAFDPTAHENGPSALLLREDLLQKYLRNEEFVLVWTIIGSKRVYYRRENTKSLDEFMISGMYRYTRQGLKGFLNFKQR